MSAVSEGRIRPVSLILRVYRCEHSLGESERFDGLLAFLAHLLPDIDRWRGVLALSFRSYGNSVIRERYPFAHATHLHNLSGQRKLGCQTKGNRRTSRSWKVLHRIIKLRENGRPIYPTTTRYNLR